MEKNSLLKLGTSHMLVRHFTTATKGVYLQFTERIQAIFVLNPYIQCAVDSKQQPLETSFNKLGEARG